MTNREFLIAITTADVADELKAYAEERLAKMDATNEARKNKPSKKAVENAPIMEQIYNEILGDEAMPASAVAEAAGISPQKASALLRALVAEGKATAADAKLTKKGTVKVYTKA
jgi:predicted Rossmann fold nucleotide-binding protein DprA/Smf involved in DNA uptake